jgi:hypothetical protein
MHFKIRLSDVKDKFPSWRWVLLCVKVSICQTNASDWDSTTHDYKLTDAAEDEESAEYN